MLRKRGREEGVGGGKGAGMCRVGYSDFHNLMGFTSKKSQIIFFKMFVKKVFQLVKPFLANLHSTITEKYSYMYSMTPKFFYFFFNI